MHQHLVGQPLHLGGHTGHVQREIKQQWQRLRAQELQPLGQRIGHAPGATAGQHKAPFAKAGHMRVVGPRRQAHRFNGGDHRPEALACHQGRSGLHHRVAAGGQALVQQRIKAVGVELADGEIGGIGEIHHDHIESVLPLLQPLEGVGVDDVQLGALQRTAVQPRQHGVGREGLGHGRVQLHQGDRFNRGVLENLAHRHAVAAAQHRHPLGRPVRGHGGVHQGFVVAVFVALGKLQVAIEKQPVPGLALGDHDALVGRCSAEHDAVLVELVFGQGGDVVCPHKARQQRAQHQHTGHGMGTQAAQLTAKQPHRPQRYGRVHQAKQQPRANQPQLRHQQQRKRQRHRQRAQVVERQHLRNQVLEHGVALQDAHDQRNLQPHQRAHHEHHAVQQEPERPRHIGIGQKQCGW